jgi:hypothetical protein
VRHLAAAEEDGELHLVAAIEESRGLPSLRFEIMIVDLRPYADLFQFDDMLIATGFALFPALLVPEFAIIHQSADRGDGVRRDLDQVEAPVARHLQRFERGNDANLLALLVDEPDLADPDTLVDAGLDGSGNNLPPLCFYRVSSDTGTRRDENAGAVAQK